MIPSPASTQARSHDNGNAAAWRARVFSAVLPVLAAHERVQGAWEGGSVAMARADAFSDIDLYVVAAHDAHVAVLDAVEAALGRAVAIAHTWRVEPSSFPGVTQRIYLLQDAPPYFQVDCAMVVPDATRQFLERERHGVPRVLFDRADTIDAPPLDRGAHEARMRTRFRQIQAAWPVYRSVVEKELARGRALDAIGFAFNGLLRPLVELAGMCHRPDRFDYGWRYLHLDLPVKLQQDLQALAYIDSPATLRANLTKIDRLAAQLFSSLAQAPFVAER